MSGLETMGVGNQFVSGRGRDLSLHHRVNAGFESAQPAIQWVPLALSSGIRRAEHKIQHSPPPTAEVKNLYSCISIRPYFFMERYLIKARDKFEYYHFWYTNVKVISALLSLKRIDAVSMPGKRQLRWVDRRIRKSYHDTTASWNENSVQHRPSNYFSRLLTASQWAN